MLCSVLSHSDEFLITGTYDRLVNVIRIESGDVIHSVEKHFDSITALAISLDDTILVSGLSTLQYDFRIQHFRVIKKWFRFKKNLFLNMAI